VPPGLLGRGLRVLVLTHQRGQGYNSAQPAGSRRRAWACKAVGGARGASRAHGGSILIVLTLHSHGDGTRAEGYNSKAKAAGRRRRRARSVVGRE